MKGKRFSFGIRKKIMLGIYLIILPVLIVGAGIVFYTNYQSIVNETLGLYQNTIHSVDDSLGYLEQDLLDISVYFSVNDDVNHLLNTPAHTIEDPLFWSKMSPMEVVKDILAIKSHIRTLILYPENGAAPLYISRDASVHDLDINSIRPLDIYTEAVAAKGDSIRTRINAGETGLFKLNRSDKVVYCRELFDLSKSKKLGFFAISLDVDHYNKVFQNALIAEDEAIVLFDAEGQQMAQVGEIPESLLLQLSRGEIHPPAANVLERVEDYYILGVDRKLTEERLFYVTPVKNWDTAIRSGLILPIILALALIVAFIPLSILVSRIITRPINNLYHSMNKFKAGDFHQQVEVRGKDEIADLATTFNSMVKEIRELIDKNYVMRIREKESELDALQAQINPHFLYNALDSLYWQAADGGQEKLAEDIFSLSSLFRLLLSSGESEIRVAEEINIITHYLHIQKMRFGKKLDYYIDVDKEVEDYWIPKLILQPFVENAIVHGLENKKDRGILRISATIEEDMLVFEIEDNGVGMRQGVLDEILNGKEDNRYANQRIGRYAIRNVKERLTLRYGSQYTFEILSELGEGSLVRLSVPVNIAAPRNRLEGGKV